MKKTLFGLLGIVGLFAACREDHSLVHLSSSSASVDTTYVLPASAIPPADPHNVLIEDFTGVTCPNCPGAHDLVLEPIENSHPQGVINIMELFVTDFPQTQPYKGETYGGFRDTVATLIEQNIYSVIFGMPCAGIDRMPVGAFGLNNTQIGPGAWSSTVNTQLAIINTINLSVSSISYDAAKRIATLVAKITYLKPTDSLQNLSIAVVEDSFLDIQEFPSTPDHPDGVFALYKYNSVFRDLVTSVPFGDPILPTVPNKEAGRVVQKVYHYHLNAAWNPNHCRIIAFVHGSGIEAGQHVFQSWQTRLVP